MRPRLRTICAVVATSIRLGNVLGPCVRYLLNGHSAASPVAHKAPCPVLPMLPSNVAFSSWSQGLSARLSPGGPGTSSCHESAVIAWEVGFREADRLCTPWRPAPVTQTPSRRRKAPTGRASDIVRLSICFSPDRSAVTLAHCSMRVARSQRVTLFAAARRLAGSV